LREELEKLRDEKDEKIQELMNQIKNLNKTHRDTINKMRIDHELALNKYPCGSFLLSRIGLRMSKIS
jgi:hypothetical protein